MKDYFTKHYGDGKGYTDAEVSKKLEAVNEAHGVYLANTKWNPAKREPDPRGGWMVTIETK